jgi:hypothetical protein
MTARSCAATCRLRSRRKVSCLKKISKSDLVFLTASPTLFHSLRFVVRRRRRRRLRDADPGVGPGPNCVVRDAGAVRLQRPGRRQHHCSRRAAQVGQDGSDVHHQPLLQGHQRDRHRPARHCHHSAAVVGLAGRRQCQSARQCARGRLLDEWQRRHQHDVVDDVVGKWSIHVS